MKGHNWGLCKKCGKYHKGSGITQKGHRSSPKTEFKKGQIPWNKGLTKDTDERVKKAGERLEGRISWAKGLTKDTDERIRKRTESNPNYGKRNGKYLSCKACEKIVYVMPYYVSTFRYCSLKCANTKGNHKYPNRMTGKKLYCDNCKKEIYCKNYQLNSIHHFCSQRCYLVWRKQYLFEHPEEHINRLLVKYRGKMTQIEKITRKFLELSGFMYEKDFVYQYPVKTEPGLKFVDFCIPKLKLLVECDGEYWHPNKDKDAERDKIILSVLGDDWRMEHLSEKEIYEIKHFLGINENE